MSAEAVIAAVRSCGNDPRDLRDAAHEACHALMFNVPRGKWDRENIHEHITSRRRRSSIAMIMYGERGTEVDAELVARAVEQVVCSRLGVAVESVDHWAHVAWMEAMQNGRLIMPHGSWVADRIRDYLYDGRVMDLADAVIALKPYRPRARTPGTSGAEGGEGGR